ncbi:hypothetical protein RCH09_002810 [Actimicrobium sp. GrIS 1.19]|nr:hypothetical protein [Actimicrobium sp. GrIS 1.19]
MISIACGHRQHDAPRAAPEYQMKMRKKSDLPSKICVQCGLPFTWRKKWEKTWNDVKYCSERCRRSTPN